jgi:two-component sensor histidine kinase
VCLDELVRSQLAHFKDLVGSRIRLEGPPLRINASAAQSLGMALHELSVNAGKYGALSNTSGQVAITWTVEEKAKENGFTIGWRESGGPKVKKPDHSGLGSLILTRLAEQSLGARVSIDFAPEGVTWTLSAPLGNVAETGLFVPL